MLVPVRGVAVNTGEQTGDGRYIVPGGIEWATLPLPFAWLVDGDQHADFSEHCPQLGTMHELVPVGNAVRYRATIDDAIPAGAESLRRMAAGSASLGHRFGVSIDPDDWAVQIVDMSGPDEGMLLLASSGHVPEGERYDWNAPWRALVTAGIVPSTRVPIRARVACGMLTTEEQERWDALVAAAGDGDPLGMGGTVVWEDSADTIISRYTRMRIRGATMCAVAAFSNCYVELDDGSPFDGEVLATDTATPATGGTSIVINTGATAEAPEVEAPAVALATVAASAPVPARVSVNLAAPPSSWFQDPGLPFASPLTITNEGRVLGHIAAWGTCHTGYTDRCVTPPRGDYDRFHVGETMCSDGSRAAVGVFAWGIPHADLTQSLMDAWAHYSDSRYGFARVASGEDAHGIWFSGALFPGLTDADISILRALSMSGDWRRDPRLRRLALVAALAVNFPGYPIPRATSITAAGGEVIDVESWESPAATMHLEGDEIMSLVACGRVAPRARLDDCGCGDGAELRVSQLEARTHRLERILTPLLPTAASALDGRVLSGIAENIDKRVG